MTPAQEIARLDKEITAIHRDLKSRERITSGSAESWQRAWDRHPDLHQRETELYRQRGFAQQRRDLAAHEMAMAAARRARTRRPRKCPTCGHHTLAA